MPTSESSITSRTFPVGGASCYAAVPRVLVAQQIRSSYWRSWGSSRWRDGDCCRCHGRKQSHACYHRCALSSSTHSVLFDTLCSSRLVVESWRCHTRTSATPTHPRPQQLKGAKAQHLPRVALRERALLGRDGEPQRRVVLLVQMRQPLFRGALG